MTSVLKQLHRYFDLSFLIWVSPSNKTMPQVYTNFILPENNLHEIAHLIQAYSSPSVFNTGKFIFPKLSESSIEKIESECFAIEASLSYTVLNWRWRNRKTVVTKQNVRSVDTIAWKLDKIKEVFKTIDPRIITAARQTYIKDISCQL